MGAKARKRVEQFTWDHYAENLLSVYDKILKNK